MSYMGMGEIKSEHFLEIDNLFEKFIPEHKEIWIFGAGEYGIAFNRYLWQCGVNANGFIVSNTDLNTIIDDKPVINISDLKSRYDKGKVGVLLALDEKYYDEVIPLLMFLGDDLCFLKWIYKKLAFERCGEQDNLQVISFHIADECNLSCYSCTACSPIADGGIYEFDQFKKDVKHLKKIFDNISKVYFTGGDVFQNPHFTEMLQLAKENWNTSTIYFSTNGISLDEQSDDFWRLLNKLKVEVRWTVYPIKYRHYDDIMEKSRNFNVDLQIFGDSFNEDKTSWHIPFAESGKEKAHDFLFCCFHRHCAVIKDGFLFPCPAMRQIPLLNSKFGTKIPITEKNVLDIHKATCAEDIQDFIAKRPPLCDYCALRERKSMGKWLPSRKEKSEWVLQ